MRGFHIKWSFPIEFHSSYSTARGQSAPASISHASVESSVWSKFDVVRRAYALVRLPACTLQYSINFFKICSQHLAVGKFSDEILSIERPACFVLNDIACRTGPLVWKPECRMLSFSLDRQRIAWFNIYLSLIPSRRSGVAIISAFFNCIHWTNRHPITLVVSNKQSTIFQESHSSGASQSACDWCNCSVRSDA